MIRSNANAHVKYIRSLGADRRERQRERCFVLEGVRLVAEALAAHVPLQLVLYASEQLALTESGQRLLAQLTRQPHCYEATPRVVAAAADTVTPQGVVAVAPWPDVAPRPGLILVLDAVQDPGNVGTLLRSAEAAGVGQVWCSRGTADIYSPKVVRAAMGAHFYLPLRSDCDWDQLAIAMQGMAQIYAAVVDATLPYYSVDWPAADVLIIGNETQGVSARGLQLATGRITIPMHGRAESLNAAIAGSIILFEALRQRSGLQAPITLAQEGDYEHYG